MAGTVRTEHSPESLWVGGLLRLPLGSTGLESVNILECVGHKNAEDIEPTFQELMVFYTRNSY